MMIPEPTRWNKPSDANDFRCCTCKKGLFDRDSENGECILACEVKR